MKYDVIVVGGGFAGTAAVVSAAREGAKVLLLEKSGFLGGAAGNCYVNPFMGYTTKIDGKTTLLSMLAGLGTPSDGEIIANGKTLKEIGSERHRRENVTVIYQSFNLFPTLNILENVMYPMQIMKKPTKEAKVRAKELLSSVGLGDVDPRKLPAMLSGGQQQRVAIARALASDAKVILADEPTGNLDTENGKVVIDLLKKLVKDENYCVIVVTHDPGIAAQADVVYKMQDGGLEKK